MFKKVWPQYLAELIGAFFLVFFGCGSVILSDLGGSSIGPSIPIIFGGVVSIMIYAVGHISGAHFNPAVTISFWATRKFPMQKVLGYIIFQTLGAVLASLVHLGIWGVDHSFGVTLPVIGVMTGFWVEVILSFVLMFVIMSVATDARAVGELAGIAIGSTVALCAFVGGPLTGASMNPARSFGPALVAFEFNSLLIYLVAPVVGALGGAFTYNWIRCHPSNDEEAQHGCC